MAVTNTKVISGILNRVCLKRGGQRDLEREDISQ